MPKTIRFTVKGAADLSRALRQLGDAEQLRRLAGGALERAGQPIMTDARNRAPKRSGALRASIKVGVRKAGKRFNRGDTVTRWVGIDGSVKRGTLAKTLRTKRGRRKSLANGVDAYSIFTEFGAPGHNVAAQPFMRPAWEASKQAAYEKLVVELRRGIDVLSRRAAGRSGKLAATMIGHNGGPDLTNE